MAIPVNSKIGIVSVNAELVDVLIWSLLEDHSKFLLDLLAIIIEEAIIGALALK